MKKAEKSNLYYPVSLDIEGKRCIVIGGGEVAFRKVRTLLEYGADVEIISPELSRELVEMGNKGLARITHRGYKTGDLQKALLVIVATDNSAVNQQVGKEAWDRGILVNMPDDPASSDFIVPSHLRRGDMTIAVSTGGRSPALARNIRKRIEQEFGDHYEEIVRLVGEVRIEAQQKKIEISSARWQEALDIDLLVDLVKKGATAEAKEVLRARLDI